MKHLYFLLGVMIALPMQAQQATWVRIDFDAIKTAVTAEDSPFFYPALFDRYQRADTTLGIEEFRYLYYGFTFQEGYRPYKRPEAESLVHDLMMKDTLASSDFKVIHDFCLEILAQHPFSARYLLTSAVACTQLGMHEEARRYYFRYDRIISTILSSGDGATTESAWSVILISDEAELISALGFSRTGRQKMLDKSLCDFIYVEANDYGIEGFYFDISRIFAGAGKDLI